MQDNISCALITAFERQYDTSWDDPNLRNERLAMRYGWTAAMEAKQCLHQIQEPAAAEQAAWHAGLDEGRTQAAGSVSNATSLAAPAAVAVSMAEPDGAMGLLEALESMVDVCEGHDFDGAPSDAHMKKARAAISAYRAALAATPAAAAQVVRPEPDDTYTRRIIEALNENGDPVSVDAAEEMERLRALLAGVSAPAALAVEPTDAELIALNAGECYFGESPSKYPELGHGTQYHAGAPGVLGFARAALALRSDPAAYSQKFQQRVQPWMMTCFGPEISADRIERNHRFLEESLELVQSLGCTASEAHQLVDYVFGRPAGEPAQEAGGVMVTLAALCLAGGLDMHACGETELARIWTKVEAIRAKQAAKPKHSPLPMHAPQAQAAASIYVTADGQRECDDWKVPLPIGRNLLYTTPQAQADAQDAGRTDAEIVAQTEELARFLLNWKHSQEPESTDSQLRHSTNRKANECWIAACEIQDLMTGTDVENAVAEVDDAAAQAAQQGGAA